MSKPLCIDLFCGLGRWIEGFLSEGWDVVGFDIERHQHGWRKCKPCDGTGNFYRHDEDGDFLQCDECGEYDTIEHPGEVPNCYPAQLVIQDVLTLDGRQFRNADCIVASPPCEEFSRHQMPWTRARNPPEPRMDLVEACWRIQRESGKPMVLENVRCAQAWIGRAKWHSGSFYLWGDVPAIMPQVTHRKKESYSSTARSMRAKVPIDLAVWIANYYSPVNSAVTHSICGAVAMDAPTVTAKG